LGKTPLFAKVGNRLLEVHVTIAAAELDWSSWGRTCTSLRNMVVENIKHLGGSWSLNIPSRNGKVLEDPSKAPAPRLLDKPPVPYRADMGGTGIEVKTGQGTTMVLWKPAGGDQVMPWSQPPSSLNLMHDCSAVVTATVVGQRQSVTCTANVPTHLVSEADFFLSFQLQNCYP
jgi:hypothetical protein